MINLGHSHPVLAPLLPFNIDFNPKVFDDAQTRLMVDIALLGIFAIPHSIFARPAVKAHVPWPRAPERLLPMWLGLSSWV